MVAFVDVIQYMGRLQQAVETALPAIESAGREGIRKAISDVATVGRSVTPTGVAVGSDLGVDAFIAKVDPTRGLDSKTFTVDGYSTPPSIKEDLSHLSHAVEAKEEQDRRRRESSEPIFNPISQPNEVLPWVKSSAPMMREGAQRESRHPFMKA